MTEVYNILEKARRAQWLTEIEEAEKIFTFHKEKDFRFAAHYAELETVRGLITEDPKTIQNAFSLIIQAQQLIDTQIFEPGKSSGVMKKFFSRDNSINKSSFLGSVISAELHLLSAGLNLRIGSYFKGSYNLFKSWKHYEICSKFYLENSSNLTDQQDAISSLQFGMGLFYFFVSLVPPKFLWIVEAIGFESNRPEGIRLLEECYQGKGCSSPAALLLLIWINRFFLEDMDQTNHLLQQAFQNYPTGVLFLYLGGYYYRKKGELEIAIECFQKVYTFSSQIAQLQINSLYEIGWCFYLMEEWNQAINYLQNFLKLNKSPSFRAFCGYQLGVCLEITNQREQALSVFEKVPSWVRKHFTYDQYAARKAKEYLHLKGMTKLEKLLQIASIQIEATHYSKALYTLDSILNSYALKNKEVYKEKHMMSIESTANYLYLRGLSLRGLQNISASENCFLDVINLENSLEQEIYLIPHSLCEMGEIYLEKGDKSSAETYFLKAKSYHDFDFDKPLARRIANSLDKLKIKDNNATSLLNPKINVFNHILSNPEKKFITTEASNCIYEEEFEEDRSFESDYETATESLEDDEGNDLLIETTPQEIHFSSLPNQSKRQIESEKEPFENNQLDAASQFHFKRKELEETYYFSLNLRKNVAVKNRRYLLKFYSKCFVGSEAVTWMEKNLNLTRGQAVQKGQQLLNANLIHHVCFSQPFLDGYYFYRFQQDVDTPILNSHFIWNLSRRSENILASLHHLLYDIYDQYLSSSGKEFNLQSFLVSPQYNEMNFSLGELQNLDLFSMTQNQKKGFFLNIYNLMSIHIHAVNGGISNSITTWIQRKNFFTYFKYKIAGATYSLDDIEHGILRSNSPLPNSLFRTFQNNKDPRVHHVIHEKDPRIHFCLNCGTISSPPLHLLDLDNLDEELDVFTQEFLENQIVINTSRKFIMLPQLFQWYASDFGSTETAILEFILKYLSQEKKQLLQNLIKTNNFSVKYATYNWATIFI